MGTQPYRRRNRIDKEKKNKLGKVYANDKMLYWFVVSTEGTIIEDLATGSNTN